MREMIMHRDQNIFSKIHRDKKQTVFSDKPPTYESIEKLIEYFEQTPTELQSIALYEEIVKILTAARDFLASTDPDYQEIRDKHLTEPKLIAIFKDPIDKLQSFNEKYNVNTSTQEVKDAFVFCQKVIVNRISSLQSNDKVHVYYHAHEHEFIKMLPPHQHKIKGR